MMRLRPLSVAILVGTLMVVGHQPQALGSTGSFIDDDNSRWEGYIEAARQEGIVTGCNPPQNDRFCPHHLVTRGTMAIMLARALQAPPSETDHFVDDDGHQAEGAIEALIGSGMRFGCDVDRFCPDRPITRGEMAAFVWRALRWDHSVPSSSYIDVGDSTFGAALTYLAHLGGLEACDAPVNRRLCPHQPVRREEAALALATSLGLDPADIEADSPKVTPIEFGDSFDELSLWDGRSPSYRNRVELTEKGFKASALHVQIPKGSHFGADFRLDFSRTIEEEPEQLFFRYFLKFDSDWVTTSSGKLPGFSGVYGTTGKGGYQSLPSAPGWSARLMFSPTRGNRTSLGYYVYHLGQGGRYGDSLRWNESGRLLPGEWYCLEGEIEMNRPGLADGALRAWVDGTPAFDRTGFEFRRPSETEIRIESFWFNVYYGGKGVPESDLGLTIDEVVVDTTRIGCEVGDGTDRGTEGDFNADGYEDTISWTRCPGGTCFQIETTSPEGRTTAQAGDGAWFSLETHRLGLATGDVDGDGISDVIYRGRCGGSKRCWRVHRLVDERFLAGEDWGNGARFSPSSTALVLGDWNGDGLDDLLYQGSCGDDAHACWRMHASTGSGFDSPKDLGPTSHTPLFPIAADLSGDGLDDLLYQQPCGDGSCWVIQRSLGSRFDTPEAIGRILPSERNHLRLIDFDGDGIVDLVSWRNLEDHARIDVRFTRPSGLSGPSLLAKLDKQVSDVLLRRVEPGIPVQALVWMDCSDKHKCIDYLVAPSSGSLADPDPFREASRIRFGLPEIT